MRAFAPDKAPTPCSLCLGANLSHGPGSAPKPGIGSFRRNPTARRIQADHIPELEGPTKEISLARQMRCMSGEIPTSLAMVRTLQRVRGFGGRVASVMTFSTLPAGIHRGRPRPFLSRNPSKPSRSKRCDHLFTQGTLTPSSSASCACLTPSERRSTIVARRLSRTDTVGAFTRRCNSCSSRSVSSIMDMGLAMPIA